MTEPSGGDRPPVAYGPEVPSDSGFRRGDYDHGPMYTDATTEQMRQETGHDCPACSSAVRNLTGTVHNALGEWDVSLRAGGITPRLHRKMAELRRALATMQPHVDEHFVALDGWRRP